MARDILILGNSGTGKSTSIRNLDPKEIFLFNVSKKPLPFRGSGKKFTQFDPATKTGNMLSTDNSSVIIKVLAWVKGNPQFKYIIMEDLNYVMQGEYLRRATETGFNKFTEIGLNFTNIISAGKSLPDDKYFIVSMHTETTITEDKVIRIKPKTVGN